MVAASEYGRIGGLARARLSNTELKYGEQIMGLPVVKTNDARLLPQTYRSTALVSKGLPEATLYAGRLETFSGRERLTCHSSFDETKLTVSYPVSF